MIENVIAWVTIGACGLAGAYLFGRLFHTGILYRRAMSECDDAFAAASARKSSRVATLDPASATPLTYECPTCIGKGHLGMGFSPGVPVVPCATCLGTGRVGEF